MSGGGKAKAEDFARNRQYDYRANSNLVLTAEQRTAGGAREPDGTAASLWGNMVGRMGDRAARTRPEGADERAAKRAKRRDGADADAPRRRPPAAGGGPSVLDLAAEAGGYRPRTRETREAYEALLAAVRATFGDVPADVLRGAADEALALLKDESLTDRERQRRAGELLGGELPDARFAQLVALGKMVTDWAPPDAGAARAGADGEGALDEEVGVAVEFDDESDDDDDGGGGLADILEDDEEDEDGDDAGGDDAGRAVRAADGGDGDAGGAGGDAGLVPAAEIDAYWLQRRLAAAYAASGAPLDAAAAQRLAEDALEALAAPDARDVENRLVLLLDFDRFDLIRELVRSRHRVVWCTRLARAEPGAARAEVEAAAAATPGGAATLAALRATRASARERADAVERGIREEARRLRAAGGGAAAAANAVADDDEAAPAAPAAAPAAPERATLDLEALAFPGGGHFRAPAPVSLPPGSYRTQQKAYEEVHVPALKPQPFAEGEKLVPIAELPEWARPGFAGMKALNRIQSRVCDAALFSGENLLVCAPTGAGKTNVAMLAMLHEVGLHRNAETGAVDADAFKVVYVAPMKALVAEMVGNFSKRLAPYGLTVRELTGDVGATRAELEAAQVIVVTPEKWDIVTRRGAERAFTKKVKLIIIDEIHLLHDDRGPVLEAIVARTLRQVETTQEMVRLVGLSATLPNFEDVAAFLRVDAARGLFHFDNSFRPCPLAQQFIGVTARRPLARFTAMNEACYAKVVEAAGRAQVLVFVHSRKETAKTARYLKDEAVRNDALGKIVRDDPAAREILAQEAEATKSADLKELLPYGFAVHHAGMARADRTLVEELFADGAIQVLVSTATLAWGVNLPAHTVIIKGTQIYNPVKGAWTELSPLDVMQMLGRAGRPQYDTQGEGIIITTQAQLPFYLSLFNMQLPVESQLVPRLPDALCAEVVLGTVSSVADAAAWLGYTYLYVRMMCNPALYGVPPGAEGGDPVLLRRRLDLAHSAAAALDRAGLVRYDRRGGGLAATELGRVAARYYVTHGTLAAFNSRLRPSMGDIELLRLFAAAEEFKFMVVRDEEKVELAKLLERVPVPIKEPLDDPAAKVNALLQAHVSALRLEGLAISADMVYVTQSAGRLARCLYEVCLRRGWARLADRALTLAKCVARRQWSSQTPLRQFGGVPAEVLARVERKDLAWERWYDLTSAEIGELVRLPKMGKTLHRLVHQFPRLELAAHVQPVTRSVLRVDLTVTPDFQWDDRVHGGAEPFVLLVEDADSEAVLHHEPFLLRGAAVKAGDDALVSFTLPIGEPAPPQYFVRLVSERWLGCEATLPVSFRRLVLPERAPPPTELLDLQPLPVSALKNGAFEALYAAAGVSHFTPVQTQAFAALYSGDGAVFVGAPAGAGKTACAEFALLRLVARAAEGGRAARAVYIGPLDAIADERYEDWATRFGPGGLGLSVVRLTGEPAADLRLLERANVAVATPRQWDALSRRWRQRKAVADVGLFVVDEAHLLGAGEAGAALEVCVSRMRYISSQQPEAPIRIVMLSAPLASARDVAEWIGAPPAATFNFPPSVRPVPLEVHVQGFEAATLEARQAAMARPAYAAVLAHAADGEPAIVFAPSRRAARALAMDLLLHAAADGAPARFLRGEPADVEPALAGVADAAVRHAGAHGVALLHEGQAPGDAAAARLLFDSGAAQVLVASAPLAWGMSATARAVVVAGTQSYGGGGREAADFPLADLLQMLGRAARPGAGGAAAAVLLCAAPRKAFYKRFLFEPLPLESCLDAFLHDHLCAEVVARTVRSKQDAVDYLTWTLFYRRLARNPNFYGMPSAGHRAVSDHLSDLVERVVGDLEAAKAVAVEDDMDLEPLNLGMVAAYYYVAYATVELLAASLGAKTKLRGLIEAVAAASEYGGLPSRGAGEERAVARLLAHAPLPVENARPGDAAAKANALLQAHFSRTPLPPDLAADQRVVLAAAPRLLQAAVDVASSAGRLQPALAAMEASQMVAQALWQRDPPLMQVPGVSREAAAAAAAAGMETVFDAAEAEAPARAAALGLDSPAAEAEAALWLARYPDVNVAHELAEGAAAGVPAGDPASLLVTLEREWPEGAPLPPPAAPGLASRRDLEGWWLVLGDAAANALLAVKRVPLQRRARVRLDFAAPEAPGAHALTLFLMCDTYMGCDQEFDLALDVLPAAAAEEGAAAGEGGEPAAPMED